MKIVCLFVLLFTLVTATISAYTQREKKPRTDADYRPRTLRELTTLLPDNFAEVSSRMADPTLRLIVHGDLLPSRVKVFYDGTTRPVNESKKGVITDWANRFAGAPEFYTVPYETEMLFSEEGESYWLVVRKESLPHFDQQLRKGEIVELFLIKLGNTRINDKLEPVLLVEKFVKQ